MASYCKTPIPNKAACKSNHGSHSKRSLSDIVDHYKKEIRPLARQELRFFAEQGNLKSAIYVAAMCEYPKGKRHDHQTRISRGVLKQSYEKLRRLDFSRFHDFESLHSRVEETIGSIHGVGPLTVYDIAHRIGAYLGLDPRKVYLHSGTREGARILGLAWRKPCLEMEEFPEDLRKLKPYEIEDCLCIYKSDFKAISGS